MSEGTSGNGEGTHPRPLLQELAQLLKEAATGRGPQSRTARWDDFYRIQSARLSRIAAARGVPPDQVEDVVQEVWLETVANWARFRGEHGAQRLLSWSAKVMHGKTVDAIRRLDRRRAQPLPADPVDGSTSPREVEEWREWLAAKLEELRENDARNCRLLCGHFLDGRPIKDLAAETGLTIHAVHCRISRALDKLRRLA
jgi:RNA polymerase sigma factor (sigma-70 family)